MTKRASIAPATDQQVDKEKKVNITEKDKKEFRELFGLEDKSLAPEWKLDVHLTSNRSLHKPFSGIIKMWAAGKGLGGDGDIAGFWCMHKDVPDAVRKGYGCGRVISSDFSAGWSMPTIEESVKLGIPDGGSIAVCPHCQLRWNPETLTAERVLALSIQHWAEVLAEEIQKIEFKGDVYLKYCKTDIRPHLMSRTITKDVRAKREPLIYTMERIIEDVTANQDIVKCMKNFLNA